MRQDPIKSPHTLQRYVCCVVCVSRVEDVACWLAVALCTRLCVRTRLMRIIGCRNSTTARQQSNFLCASISLVDYTQLM